MSDDIIHVGQLQIRYLLDGAAAGHMGVFELTVPPQANAPPPHSHAHNDEFIRVIEGVLRYTVDDLTRDLNPGEWMFSPRGSVHAFSNPGSITTRALSVINT